MIDASSPAEDKDVTIMSLHVAYGIHLSNYVALATLAKNGSYLYNFLNFTPNENMTGSIYKEDKDYLMSSPAVKAFFYFIYAIIFLLGISGNTLVCYVVFCNKSMQTVTNFFIMNLGLSDILLCIFAVPFTPLYILMQEWVFGKLLCHLVPYVQGVSVYISAFTLMSVAVHRYFVIIYPLKSRVQLSICYSIIVLIWIISMLLTIPYGIFVDIIRSLNGKWYCDEVWPSESNRRAFGFSTSTLQFVLPFIIITFCYVQICGRLNRRVKHRPGMKSIKKEEIERERTGRTNRMLIAMVVIFGASWLPLNIYNLIVDFYIPASNWRYMNVFFFLSHAVAMSSICYNPFVYAWLNDNFRKQFKVVFCCSTTKIDFEHVPNQQLNKTCNSNNAIAMDNILPKHNLTPDIYVQK